MDERFSGTRDARVPRDVCPVSARVLIRGEKRSRLLGERKGRSVADHVIYIDRFEIRDSKLEDFKRYATDMAAFVQEQEPKALSFNYYVNDGGRHGTAVFVFADADALDAHLDVASSRFQEGYALLSATEIELLGDPSERAVELAESFNGTISRKIAGFGR